MNLKLKENWFYSYSFLSSHGLCRVKQSLSVEVCLNITSNIEYKVFETWY